MSFQHASLKWKWLGTLLQESAQKSFWCNYLTGALKIDIQDFLRCNILYTRVHCFFTDYESVPIFWKLLFKDWFAKCYISSKPFWESVDTDRGVLFNMALGHFRADFTCYAWLKRRGAFTITEVQAIWEFLSEEERTYLLNYFPCTSRQWITNLLQTTGLFADKLFCVLSSPTVTVKSIYSHLIQSIYKPPSNVWSKWETDLELKVDEFWDNLCCASGLIYETNLQAFHIQFLHRAYCLNPIVAKYTNISPNCAFCDNAKETYIHLFWECPHVSTLWDKVIQFCNDYICTRGDIMCKDTCLLSNFRSSLLVTIVSKVKHYIFVSRLN